MKAERIYTVHRQHGYCPSCKEFLYASSKRLSDVICDNCGENIEWEEFITKDELREYVSRNLIGDDPNSVKSDVYAMGHNKALLAIRKQFDL